MSRYASQDRLRRDNQQKDLARETTLHKLNEDAVLLANEGSSKRVEVKRHMRILSEQQRERDAIEAMESRRFAETNRKIQEEQEEILARELQRLKDDQISSEKKRQQLRETNVELRDLEAKLKAAYLTKELYAQKAEREAAVRADRDADLTVDRELDKFRVMEEEAEALRQQQAAIVNRQHQSELLQQLEDQKEQQRLAFEEFLKEKMMIDEIVQKISEEDRRAHEHELSRKLQTKREMEEFKQQQEQWRRAEQDQMALENQQMMEHAQAQTARFEELQAARQQRAAQRAAVQENLLRQVQDERTAKEELERVRLELSEEEMHARERQRERQEMEARLRQRLTLQQNEVEDLAMRQRQKEREREEEEEFRRAMMEKFAIDDKIEQMNAQKRRLRQLDHKRAVDVLLEERRQRFQFEKEQQRREAERTKQDEAGRRALVEQERQRMLREHAHRLLGFLPKGVLRDQQDVAMLGDSFRAVYAPQRPADDEY